MTGRAARATFAAGLLAFAGLARACPVTLEQPDGANLNLDAPAARVITLAPHLAELVFAAGAGDALLATVEYSDYPPDAAALPRIGDAFRFDLERILALRPDLLLAWDSGNPAPALARLDELGLPVWRVEIRRPDDLAPVLRAIGRATGRERPARATAESVEAALARLRERYADRAPVSYFYQVAERPLYTVNGEHLISQGLALCGGVNVFAGLDSLAPQVAHEAVLLADPRALIAPRISAADRPLDHWLAWPRLRAVREDSLLYLPADEISRATPRMLDSVALACKLLDGLRRNQADTGEKP